MKAYQDKGKIAEAKELEQQAHLLRLQSFTPVADNAEIRRLDKLANETGKTYTGLTDQMSAVVAELEDKKSNVGDAIIAGGDADKWGEQLARLGWRLDVLKLAVEAARASHASALENLRDEKNRETERIRIAANKVRAEAEEKRARQHTPK